MCSRSRIGRISWKDDTVSSAWALDKALTCITWQSAMTQHGPAMDTSDLGTRRTDNRQGSDKLTILLLSDLEVARTPLGCTQRPSMRPLHRHSTAWSAWSG